MKKVKTTGSLLITIGSLLLIFSLFLDKYSAFLSITGVIIACLGFIYFMIFWRCPFCRKPLPSHGMIGMMLCPYCGNKLDF